MVSEEQAEAVLAKIKEQFKAYIVPDLDEPALIKNYAGRPGYVITWESGPYEWADRAFAGGVDEELTELVQEFTPGAVMHTEAADKVPGVFCEPITTFILGIYED